MMQIPNRDAVALSARTLGALFSYAPNSEQNAPLVAAFLDGSWQPQWPFPVSDSLAMEFAASSDEALPQARRRLFIGPWALPAPPWGSVWLDKESVLFGDSTLALREWMRTSGIALDLERNEPEDHFEHCCCWPHGCVKQIRMSCLRNCWHGIYCRGRAFSERLYGKRRASVLSGAGPTGAVDAG